MVSWSCTVLPTPYRNRTRADLQQSATRALEASHRRVPNVYGYLRDLFLVHRSKGPGGSVPHIFHSVSRAFIPCPLFPLVTPIYIVIGATHSAIFTTALAVPRVVPMPAERSRIPDPICLIRLLFFAHGTTFFRGARRSLDLWDSSKSSLSNWNS